jgi:hypothetical protein
VNAGRRQRPRSTTSTVLIDKERTALIDKEQTA